MDLASLATILAPKLAASVIGFGASRLRNVLLGNAEVQALEKVIQQGFAALLSTAPTDLDTDSLALLSDILVDFVHEPEVASMLLVLALHPDEVDFTQLRERFNSLGFDSDTLQMDFELGFRAYVSPGEKIPEIRELILPR